MLFWKRISAEMLMDFLTVRTMAMVTIPRHMPRTPAMMTHQGRYKQRDTGCNMCTVKYSLSLGHLTLEQGKEKLETVIYRFCRSYNLPLPRQYGRRARKDYLAFAKGRKHSAKKIHRHFVNILYL